MSRPVKNIRVIFNTILGDFFTTIVLESVKLLIASGIDYSPFKTVASNRILANYAILFFINPEVGPVLEFSPQIDQVFMGLEFYLSVT